MLSVIEKPGNDGSLNEKLGSVNANPKDGSVQLLTRSSYGATKTVADGTPRGPDVPNKTVLSRMAPAPR